MNTDPAPDPLPCSQVYVNTNFPLLCCIGVVRDGTVVKTPVDDEDKAWTVYKHDYSNYTYILVFSSENRLSKSVFRIRIQGQWIRIRIQEDKNDPQK